MAHKSQMIFFVWEKILDLKKKDFGHFWRQKSNISTRYFDFHNQQNQTKKAFSLRPRFVFYKCLARTLRIST